MKLTAGAEIASTTWAGDVRVGPMHSHAVAAALTEDGEKARGLGTLAIASDPAGCGGLCGRTFCGADAGEVAFG